MVITGKGFFDEKRKPSIYVGRSVADQQITTAYTLHNIYEYKIKNYLSPVANLVGDRVIIPPLIIFF